MVTFKSIIYQHLPIFNFYYFRPDILVLGKALSGKHGALEVPLLGRIGRFDFWELDVMYYDVFKRTIFEAIFLYLT